MGEESIQSLESFKKKKKKGKKGARLADAFESGSDADEVANGGIEKEVPQSTQKGVGFAALADGNESEEDDASGSEKDNDDKPAMPVTKPKSRKKKGKQGADMGSAFAALTIEEGASNSEQEDEDGPVIPMTKPKSKKKKGKGGFGSAFAALDVEEDEDPEDEAEKASTGVKTVAGSAFAALAMDDDEKDGQSDGNDDGEILRTPPAEEKSKSKKKKKGKGLKDVFAALEEEETAVSLGNGANANEPSNALGSSKKKKKSKGLASAFDALAEETEAPDIGAEQMKVKKGKKKKEAVPLDDAFAALDEDEGPSMSMGDTSGAFASLAEEGQEDGNDVSSIPAQVTSPKETKVTVVCWSVTV